MSEYLNSQLPALAELLQSRVLEFIQDKEDLPEFEQLREDYGEQKKLVNLVQHFPPPPTWIPYPKQLLVTPSNGLLATIDSTCYQLLTQAKTLLVSPSSRDSVGREFLEFLRDHGHQVEVVRGGEALRSPRLGRHYKSEVIEEFCPDLAILYGSDESLQTLQALLPAHCRVVKYGSKTSIGVHHLGTSELHSQTQNYAKDFFSYQGIGCLNTSVLYVVDPCCKWEGLKEWVGELVSSREELSVETSWESSVHLQSSMIKSDLERLYQEQGVFLRDTSRQDSLIGVGRGTAVVVLCSSLDDVEYEWQGRGHLLSSCTYYAGADSQVNEEEAHQRLFELGVTRITVPGRAQSPSFRWRHDGLPLVPIWGREVSLD